MAQQAPRLNEVFNWVDESPQQPAEPAPEQNTGAFEDLVSGTLATVAEVPGAVTGLADMLTQAALSPVRAVAEIAEVNGADNQLDDAIENFTPFTSMADAAGEFTGFQPGEWANDLRAEYSPERQAAIADRRQAWDEGRYGDYAAELFSHPVHNIINPALESLPLMAAGGGIGAGVKAATATQLLQKAPHLAKHLSKYAFAVGEGAISGGLAMDQLVEQGVRPSTAAMYAGATTLTTGAFGAAGGHLGQRMGLTDLDVALTNALSRRGAGAAAGEAATSGLAGRVAAAGASPGWKGAATRFGGGAFTEGVFEEAPQSAFEQLWQNAATGEDLLSGVGPAAIEGGLAGAALGGAFNAMRRPGGPQETTAPDEGEQPPSPVVVGPVGPTDSAAPDTQERTPQDVGQEIARAVQEGAQRKEKARNDGPALFIETVKKSTHPNQTSRSDEGLLLVAVNEKRNNAGKTPLDPQQQEAFLAHANRAGISFTDEKGALQSREQINEQIALWEKVADALPKKAQVQPKQPDTTTDLAGAIEQGTLPAEALNQALDENAATANTQETANAVDQTPTTTKPVVPQDGQGTAAPPVTGDPQENAQTPGAVVQEGGPDQQAGLLEDDESPVTGSEYENIIRSKAWARDKSLKHKEGKARDAADFFVRVVKEKEARGDEDPYYFTKGDYAAHKEEIEDIFAPTKVNNAPQIRPFRTFFARLKSDVGIELAKNSKAIQDLISRNKLEQGESTAQEQDPWSGVGSVSEGDRDYDPGVRDIHTEDGELVDSDSHTYTDDDSTSAYADTLSGGLRSTRYGTTGANVSAGTANSKKTKAVWDELSQSVEDESARVPWESMSEELRKDFDASYKGAVSVQTDAHGKPVYRSDKTTAAAVKDVFDTIRKAARIEQADKRAAGTQQAQSEELPVEDLVTKATTEPAVTDDTPVSSDDMERAKKQWGLYSSGADWDAVSEADKQFLARQVRVLLDRDSRTLSPKERISGIRQHVVAIKESKKKPKNEQDKAKNEQGVRDAIAAAKAKKLDTKSAETDDSVTPAAPAPAPAPAKQRTTLSVKAPRKKVDEKSEKTLVKAKKKRSLEKVESAQAAYTRTTPTDIPWENLPNTQRDAIIDGVAEIGKRTDIDEEHKANLRKELIVAQAIAAQEVTKTALAAASQEKPQSLKDALSGALAQKQEVAPEQTPREARGDSARKASSQEDIQAAVNEAIGNTPTAQQVHIVENENSEGVPTSDTKQAQTTDKKIMGLSASVNGKRHVWIFSDNVPAARAKGVLYHELTHHNWRGLKQFVDQVKTWAADTGDSLEAKAARAADKQVKSLQASDTITDQTVADEELVAYFVENAVRLGIDPKTGAGAKTLQARSWFKRLWDALAKVFRASGRYDLTKITAQDIVTMVHDLAVAGKPQTQRRGGLLFSVSQDDNQARFAWSPVAAAKAAWNKQQAKNLKEDGHNTWMRWGLGAYPMYQLIRRLGSAAVKQVGTVLEKIDTFAREKERIAAEIENRWAQLPQDAKAKMHKIMIQARRLGYDPAGDGDYALNNIDVLNLRADYRRLIAAYPDAKGVYTDVRDWYADHYIKPLVASLQDMVKELEKDQMTTKDLGKVELLGSLKDVIAQAKHVYFPLKRFGDHHVVAMSKELADLERTKAEIEAADDPDVTFSDKANKRRLALRKQKEHYWVESVFGARAARKRAQELEAEFPAEHIRYSPNEFHPHTQAMAGTQFVGAYRKRLEDLAGGSNGMTPEAVDIAVNEFAQAMYELLPEGHAAKSLIRAEKVHGEEQDMQAVFAKTVPAAAHHLSRLVHGEELAKSIDAMRKAKSTNRDDAYVHNEIMKRINGSMAYEPTPITNALMNLSFFSHLAASPVFVLMNMHQVPMVTLPWLQARLEGSVKGRWGKVSGALWQAAKDTKTLITFSKTSAKDAVTGDGDIRAEIDIAEIRAKYEKIADPKERARKLAEVDFLERAVDAGVLDVTIEMGMSAVASTGHRRTRNLMRSLTLPVHLGELYNRGSTGLAAYRLGLEKFKGDHNKAIAFGIEALNMTQMNYSAMNTPRYMQRLLGSPQAAKVVFQFWKYRVGMLSLISSSFYDAFKSEDQQTQKEARRTLRGLFGASTLAAGVFGAPLVSGSLGLASLLAGLGADDDEPVDFERDLKNMLSDIDPQLAEVLSKGVWSLAGLDISKRLSLGDLADPLSFAKFGGDNAKDDAGALLTAVAGAPTGMVINLVDAIYKAGDGDFAPLLQQFPVKGVKDVFRGIELANEGIKTRRGETVIPGEEFSVINWRTFGGQPMKASRYYESNAAIQEVKEATKAKRQKLVAKFAQARIKNESVAGVRKEIAAFNRKHPHKGYVITADSLTRAVLERRKIARSRDTAGVIRDSSTAPFKDYGRFGAMDS